MFIKGNLENTKTLGVKKLFLGPHISSIIIGVFFLVFRIMNMILLAFFLHAPNNII